MSITPLTVPPKKLAQTISATQLTFKMNNIEGWNGEPLTPADFGTEAYGVFINSTRTQIEIFSFDPTTIADAEITINARGLGYSGQIVSDPARQFPWASNDTTIQLGTDAPQLFRDFMSESNTNTITALHTYNVLPRSAVTPTDDEDFATKQYVDGLTEPAVTVPVNQVAHGLVVGDVIRVSGANLYTKAQANSATGSEVAGVVIEVVDADNFKYITEGIFEDAAVPSYPAGTVVFLSRTTAGAFVDTDTATIGEVSAPLGIILQNGAKMMFHKYRPAIINTISGNPIASETVAGTVEIATQTQVDNGTDVGETGAPLVVLPSRIPAGGNIEVVGRLLESVDTTSGPKAVSYTENGGYITAVTDATNSQNFAGFLDDNTNHVVGTPGFLVTSNQISVGTVSTTTPITIPAGDNVGLIVHHNSTGGGSTSPASMTFNGLPLTQVFEEAVVSPVENVSSAWYIALGNLASPLTADLVIGATGGATMRLATAVAYENVQQTTPTVFGIDEAESGVVNVPISWSFPVGEAIVSQYATCRQASFNVLISTAGNVLVSDDNLSYTAYNLLGADDRNLTVSGSATGTVTRQISGVVLQKAGPQVTARINGIQSGFTGLTTGARYYVDANGDPTLTGDGQFIGRAYSPTQIVINNVKDSNDSWELVRVAVNSVQQNFFDITDLGGYTELMIVAGGNIFGRPDSSAGTALAYVSTDNGATFLTTNSYLAGPTSATDDNIFIASNPAGDAYIVLHFLRWSTDDPFKPLITFGTTSNPYKSSPNTALPLNAIRFTVSGTYWVNIGATFYIYGKRY